ncbi:MAG: sensor histidine kinase [Rectinema subterraneum]|uniref:sensor histidine kinase n=1 Tax=Rectinema subterraneum TaxID=2653714 RepID=UPI003C79FC4C
MSDENISGDSPFSHIRKLRPHERAMFAGILLALVIALGATAYFSWQSILRDKQAYIEVASRYKAEQITSWYNEHMIEAVEISISPVIFDAVVHSIAEPTSANLKEIENYLMPILRTYNYADSVVMTADLKVLVSLTNFSQPKCEIIQQELGVRGDDKPFMTSLHLVSPYAKPGLHIVIPLVDTKTQKPIAYVVHTVFSDDFFYPILAQWPGNEHSGETLLLKRTDGMIQVLNPLKLVRISAFSLQISASDPDTVEARAGRGATGFLSGKDYRGKRVLAVASRVPELDWTVLSKIDIREALSGWYLTLAILILFGIIAFVALVAGAYVLLSSRAISSYRARLDLLQRTERNEALLNAILERIDSLVVITGKNLAVQFSNQAYQARFGTEWPKDLPDPQQATPEGPKPEQARKIELIDTNGNRVRLLMFPIKIELRGQEPLLGYVMRDITELESALDVVQQLNQELSQKVQEQTQRIREADEELRAIAAAISHNLAEPVRSIESFSELLYQEISERSSAEAMDYLMRIRRASANMASLTSDLITFLSLDTVPLSLSEFDFSLAAQEITSDIIRRNPGRRYQITIIPGLKMQCDRKLMNIALRNVIDNAFKYCSDNTITAIEIGKIGQSGIFVKDNGIGMMPDEIKKIFTPFSERKDDRYEPGFSVGLAVTKKIIERHGGSIEIESELGKGTTVYFKF